MAGLLSDVLPWVYSRGNALQRGVRGLLADPIGTAQQAEGLLQDQHREQERLNALAYADPKNPLRVTDRNAFNTLIDRTMAGPMGFAPAGMTAIKSGMASYKGGNEGPQYQIDHKPMKVEGGAARLHDLESVFGADIYGQNARQYFGSGGADVFGQAERATLRKMAELRGKPDAMVTVYRGVPDGVRGINPGDWVTLDPRVAREYGNVVSLQVPAAHVTSWPDSLLEFGYFPTK